MARPNHRTSHNDHVPNSGGVILCFAVLLPLLIFSSYNQDENFNLLLAAFAVLLITGVIDDFNPIPVFYKFLGQFIPAIVIVSSFSASDLLIPFISSWITLPSVFNYLFWILVIVMIMNAYNLIDGIDGLAIGLGLFAGITYGVFFIQLGQANLALFAFALSGGLLGLLFFNLSNRNKIFIGDTGSLFLGGIIGYFSLRYLNLRGSELLNQSTYHALGILFLPLFDMIRVVFKRLSQRKSPFVADRCHIHHILLDRFHLKHIHTAALLVFFQALVFTFLFFTSRNLVSGYLIFAVLLLVFYFVLVNALEHKKRQDYILLLIYLGMMYLGMFLGLS